MSASAEILLADDAIRWAHWALDSGHVIVGHGVSYDFGVLCAKDPSLLPKVFAAYRMNRITDTELRQKLADIGRGRYRTRNYDLQSVGAIHGFPVNKADPWRLRYAELDGVPLESWPPEAVNYAKDDALCTAHAFVTQETKYAAEGLLVDQFAQARKFWALDLCSAWGLRTSERGVLSLEAGATQRLNELGEWLGEECLIRTDGSRNTKAAKARMLAVCAADGRDFKPTKSGDVSLDSDACKESGDPLLEVYAEYSSMKKVLSNDVEMLRKGITMPIHTNFDIADSGRVTSAKPNIQNPRRLPGVRECYVPRN